MYRPKSKSKKTSLGEVKPKAVAGLALLLAVGIMGSAGWSVVRILHNESIIPSHASSASSKPQPALGSGSDNQSLVQDLNTLKGELTQSKADVAQVQTLVNDHSN